MRKMFFLLLIIAIGVGVAYFSAGSLPRVSTVSVQTPASLAVQELVSTATSNTPVRDTSAVPTATVTTVKSPTATPTVPSVVPCAKPADITQTVASINPPAKTLPRTSPSGDLRLVYASQRTGTLQFWSFSPHNGAVEEFSPTLNLPEDRDLFSITVSGDELYLAYKDISSFGEGPGDLFILDTVTKRFWPITGWNAEPELTYGDSLLVESWQPDGTFFVGNYHTYKFHLVSIDGKIMARLPVPSWPAVYGPRFSPDGIRILFTQQRVGPAIGDVLCSNSIDGTDPKILLDNEGGYVLFSDWSPDGNLLVFEKPFRSAMEGELWVMKADGSGRQRLNSDSEWDSHPAWSPDGKTIAFLRRENSENPHAYGDPRQLVTNLWLVDVETGKTTQVTAFENKWVRGINWAPDSSWISFVTSPTMANDSRGWPTTDIWIADLETKSLHNVAAGEKAPYRPTGWLHVK